MICYQESRQSKRWQLEEQDLRTFLQRHLPGVLKIKDLLLIHYKKRLLRKLRQLGLDRDFTARW